MAFRRILDAVLENRPDPRGQISSHFFWGGDKTMTHPRSRRTQPSLQCRRSARSVPPRGTPTPPPKFAVFHSEIVKNCLDELRPFPSYIVLGQVPHPYAARVGRQSPLHLRAKQSAAPQVTVQLCCPGAAPQGVSLHAKQLAAPQVLVQLCRPGAAPQGVHLHAKQLAAPQVPVQLCSTEVAPIASISARSGWPHRRWFRQKAGAEGIFC